MKDEPLESNKVGDPTPEQNSKTNDDSKSIRSYDDSATEAILNEHTQKQKNLGTLLNARAAKRAGAELDWVSKTSCVAKYGGKQILLSGYICDQSQVGARIVSDKFLVKRFLMDSSVPTSKGRMVSSSDEAVQVWMSDPHPIVLKPRDAYGGKGVTVNLSSEKEIRLAFDRANSFGDGEVLLEDHIEGTDEYRCLATTEKCVSVVKRLLPNVTGDGKSTIESLISRKNSIRKRNPSTVNRYIPIDAITTNFLGQSGYTLNTILDKGVRVIVRDVGGLSSGGEPYECFEEVPQELKDAAIRAIRAIPGLTWGGVDIMLSKADNSPFVIEINSSADIAGSMFPMYGKPKDVASIKWSKRLSSARISGNRHFDIPVDTARGSAPKIGNSFHPLWGKSPKAKLSKLVARTLEGRGYSINKEGPGILSVEDDDETIRWFTSDFMGLRDQAVARRAVRRYRKVRKLFRAAQVHRPRVRIISERDELCRFIFEAESDVIITPDRSEWRGSRQLILNSRSDIDNELFIVENKWIAQARPEGESLRIFATPERALWVLAESSKYELSRGDLAAAVAAATNAVNAVPQLRWACVDVVLSNKSGALSATVEGLSVDVNLESSLTQLAGSFEYVLDRILR